MKAAVAIVGPCDPAAAERIQAAARDGRLAWAGQLAGATGSPSEAEWKEFAARATAPWLLAVCGDEELGPELAREILDLPEAQPDGIAAYRVRIAMRFIGRTIVGGRYRAHSESRLVRREHAVPEIARLALGARLGNGPSLEAPLGWRPFESLEDGLARIDRETSELALAPRRPPQRARSVDFLFRPPVVLLRELVLRGGLRDGIPGFVLATLAAARELILYAKLWEQGLPEHLRQVPSNPQLP